MTDDFGARWFSPGNPLLTGFKSGKSRLEESHLVTDGLYFEEIAAIVKRHAKRRPQYSPQFWRLFSELLTIAVGARLANGEPGLEEEEIMHYIDEFADFFNSFKCP
ncbi:hypothetical protein [Streptomyces sp. CB02959]|uniref:hypothetical protein n=1 Tax=Streptomyces sp. CB02959 TaxID=2020330 RepID=UPI0011AEDA80|nr:hypothetical protein [Streptomyces sp. CB02959]